ncbi:MAG: hypothetical protein ABIU18_05180 [Novosphingobium sp.]
MSRIATSPPIPKAMYRHFTVITLLATACIAIFADGERRQTISDEIDAQNQKAALRQAEADKIGAGTTGRREIHYAPRGGWGADDVVDTEPLVTPQALGYSVADANGGMRVAGGGDFGMIGPMTAADNRNGRFPLPKTGPTLRTGGSKSPTADQRRAFERALASRAGVATPVN